MSHRVHISEEQLKEHLEQREWSKEDQDHLLHMIGRSALLSCQSALTVLQYQQAIDERIEAEKRFDEAFVPRVPQDFFEQRFEGLK